MLKFFYNGIKGSDGKLQKAYYSEGKLLNHPDGTITIYGKNYSGFSAEVNQTFEVENGTDIMSDYFEQDRIRVTPAHPLYAQVRAALEQGRARSERRYAARMQQVSA